MDLINLLKPMECNDHVVAPRCGDAQWILINLLKPMECNDHEPVSQ